MLFRSNLIAVVAGGNKQKYAENTLLLWDDALKKFVLELTFATPVLAIRLRKDKIFVAERTRVHVFDFPSNVKKVLTIDTPVNNRGLLEVSMYPSSERQVMILPGFKTGTLQVTDLTAAIMSSASSSSPVNINAHENDVTCIALNSQGTRVATASVKGTLIRVFDTLKATRLVELRRGTDPATLYCISFSADSDFLCASSDKGTVHIFALRDTHLNKRSSLAHISKFVGSDFGESQYSLTNFTVKAECACICGFGPRNTVYAICVDGSFHKYTFNTDPNKKGGAVQLAYDVFSDLPEDDDI
jgi:WD40 repeat protein